MTNHLNDRSFSRRSSNEDELSLRHSSTASDTLTSTLSSNSRAISSAQSNQQQQARNTTSEKKSSTGPGLGGKSRLALCDVVARRAFECTVADGVLSKVTDLLKESGGATAEVGDSLDASRAGVNETTGHQERHQRRYDGTPPGSEFRVEAVPFGADIDVGHEDTSKCFWGLDLHRCDLQSLVGLPAEVGVSPWDSEGGGSDEDEEGQWRCICVFLDVSLNRLRGIDAIADQPSLGELVYLDVSYNLVDDLNAVQDLPDLQVLLASNNQVDAVQALGEMPKGSGLCHVDLSNNLIAAVDAPQSADAFRYVKSLKLGSNRLKCFDEDAALALTSLEQLDVSDNELVSLDWVACLQALRFLDCSANRVSVLFTCARALATPSHLTEVIAEGNPVSKEPQYRLTLMTQCKRIKRLDHRPVDAAALKRHRRWAEEAESLASVREIAHKEYHWSVEGERFRLERRRSVLKAQERQLDEAFQAYRSHKQREIEECIAYAETLRGEQEQLLTPGAMKVFREATRENNESSKRGHGSDGGKAGRRIVRDEEHGGLKSILQDTVARQRLEAKRRNSRSSSGGSSSRSWSGESSSELSGGDVGGGSEYEAESEQGQSGLRQSDRKCASSSKKTEPGLPERSGLPSVTSIDEAPTNKKKIFGGGIVRSVLGTLGWRKAAGSSGVSNSKGKNKL